MEGDPVKIMHRMPIRVISTHALRMEGDGSTSREIQIDGISTHALRMEGDPVYAAKNKRLGISTHALRMEGDQPGSKTRWMPPAFLPTPSAWRATICAGDWAGYYQISIHALRMEGD